MLLLGSVVGGGGVIQGRPLHLSVVEILQKLHLARTLVSLLVRMNARGSYVLDYLLHNRKKGSHFIHFIMT